MYIWYIWLTYSTDITKKEITNVEIQEQTASLTKMLRFRPCYSNNHGKVLVVDYFVQKKTVQIPADN